MSRHARKYLLVLGLVLGCSLVPVVSWGQDHSPDRWLNWNTPNISDNNRSATPTVTSTRAAQWNLGVRGINTRTGILIREVSANSAAARVGLREGDSILTVGGQQVGLVGTRLFELDQEVSQRASSNGVVTIMSHSGQTGRLSTLDVQLQPNQVALSGMVVQLNRLDIPTDAMINIQINNVTRPYFGVRNGSISIRPTGSSTIPFSIAYDPSYISAQDRYEVSATVTSRGNVLYRSERNYPVLTQGNPSQIEIRLTSANTNWNTGSNQGSFANNEAIDRYIESVYMRILGRRPYYIEHATLLLDPQLENRLRSLPLDLMASQEFYDAVGNNDTAWIERVFNEMAGRRPLSSELENWRKRFAELRYSRSNLLAQLDSQVRR